MFYIATAFWEGEGLSYSKHSAAIAAFGTRFARKKRIPVEFHPYLIDAESIRLRADYNTELDISETDVEQLLSQGGGMLNFALENIDWECVNHQGCRQYYRIFTPSKKNRVIGGGTIPSFAIGLLKTKEDCALI